MNQSHFQVAKFAKFYGLKFDDVNEMSLEDFNVYWEAITVIEAQETLRELIVSTFPQLNKSQREKQHRSLYKKAYPSIFKESRPLRTEDLASLLKG